MPNAERDTVKRCKWQKMRSDYWNKTAIFWLIFRTYSAVQTYKRVHSLYYCSTCNNTVLPRINHSSFQVDILLSNLLYFITTAILQKKYVVYFILKELNRDLKQIWLKVWIKKNRLMMHIIKITLATVTIFQIKGLTVLNTAGVLSIVVNIQLTDFCKPISIILEVGDPDWLIYLTFKASVYLYINVIGLALLSSMYSNQIANITVSWYHLRWPHKHVNEINKQKSYDLFSLLFC